MRRVRSRGVWVSAVRVWREGAGVARVSVAAGRGGAGGIASGGSDWTSAATAPKSAGRVDRGCAAAAIDGCPGSQLEPARPVALALLSRRLRRVAGGGRRLGRPRAPVGGLGPAAECRARASRAGPGGSKRAARPRRFDRLRRACDQRRDRCVGGVRLRRPVRRRVGGAAPPAAGGLTRLGRLRRGAGDRGSASASGVGKRPKWTAAAAFCAGLKAWSRWKKGDHRLPAGHHPPGRVLRAARVAGQSEHEGLGPPAGPVAAAQAAGRARAAPRRAAR